MKMKKKYKDKLVNHLSNDNLFVLTMDLRGIFIDIIRIITEIKEDLEYNIKFLKKHCKSDIEFYDRIIKDKIDKKINCFIDILIKIKSEPLNYIHYIELLDFTLFYYADIGDDVGSNFYHFYGGVHEFLADLRSVTQLIYNFLHQGNIQYIDLSEVYELTDLLNKIDYICESINNILQR